MLWTNTSAYTGSARVWIGRGDEWIRPVVDIQKRSLRTFEADLLASFQRLVQQIGRIADLILDLLRQRQIFVSDGIRVERFYAVELRQQIVFQRHSVCQTCAEIVRIHHIAHAQARARAFIHVARADAVFRGADLGVALCHFLAFILLDVIRHDQMAAIADAQAAHVHAFCLQVFHFFNEHLEIDHDTVADDTGCMAGDDPRWDQAQLKFFAIDHNRVASVVAALVTHNIIRALCEVVGDLPFPFVAPLCA